MRVDSDHRYRVPKITGRVVLAATAAASAWLFVPNHKFNLGNSGGADQESNPAASDQMNGEIGHFKIGNQVLSITKYAESAVENDPSKMEVLIYGKSDKDPREVMNDSSWKLVIGSSDGQFPAVMAVYPPAVENGVSADNSGFSYDVVIRVAIPSGTPSYSLEIMHDMGDGAIESQSIPIGLQDKSLQKRT